MMAFMSRDWFCSSVITTAPKVPSSSLSQSTLLAAAGGDQEHLALELGVADRRGCAGGVAVPEIDDGADVRILLQHGRR